MQKKEGIKQVSLMKLQSVAASQMEKIGKRKSFSACKFYCNETKCRRKKAKGGSKSG